MAAVASATLRGSSSRRFSSPLDSPMDLQGRVGQGQADRQGQGQGRLMGSPQIGLAGRHHVAPPELLGTQAISSSQATSCSSPKVLHQLHRITVVNLDVVHINRWDAQPRPRQQVARIPHLAGRAGAWADR